MEGRLTDLRDRELIDIADGSRFGCAEDLEVDWERGKVLALVVPGRLRLFGLLGREEDVVVPMEAVRRIGEDLILVDSGHILPGKRRKGKGQRKNRR